MCGKDLGLSRALAWDCGVAWGPYKPQAPQACNLISCASAVHRAFSTAPVAATTLTVAMCAVVWAPSLPLQRCGAQLQVGLHQVQCTSIAIPQLALTPDAICQVSVNARDLAHCRQSRMLPRAQVLRATMAALLAASSAPWSRWQPQLPLFCSSVAVAPGARPQRLLLQAARAVRSSRCQL